MSTKSKIIVATLVSIILIIGGTVVYWIIGPRFAKIDARVQGDINQEYIIQDARTRVSTYEWFYDQYEQIEATRINAELAKGTENERGILMVLSQMIAEYNAMARKEHTRAQWMPDDLPYQIEMEVER